MYMSAHESCPSSSLNTPHSSLPYMRARARLYIGMRPGHHAHGEASARAVGQQTGASPWKRGIGECFGGGGQKAKRIMRRAPHFFVPG